jgi:uncharacterized membrane protein
MEEFGPVQIMVVGFEGTEFTGEVLAELRRLKDADLVRIVDLVAVAKDASGDVAAVELSDLTDEEREEFGAIVGALIGLGMEGTEEGLEAGAAAGAAAAEERVVAEEVVWSIADTIPPSTTAAVVLLEHRWAIPLRDAIIRAGGVPLADTWIHPEDLVAAGAAAAEAKS